MDHGHARIRHRGALGDPTSEQFTARIARHLGSAREGYAVDSHGYRCYLIVDRPSNQVAWIPPHKEHRATFFQPDDGVADYLRTQRRVQRGSLRRLDVFTIRRGAMAREATRSIFSAQRVPPSSMLDR
jgi:hypothetical protein